jgi:hypothetical protein
MKQICVLSFLLGLAIFASAQDDMKLIKEGVTMREGKVYKIGKDGSTTLLSADFVFENGSTVSKNGDFTWNSGFKTRLREGDFVLKNGTLGIAKSRVKTISGFIKRDGVMLEILRSDLRSFEGEKTILDSNRLSADGKYYIGKSGKSILLAENEIIGLDGEIFLNADEVSPQESYVTKRDGAVIKAVNNKMAIVDGEYLFPNGMKVTSQGVVSTKEGVSFSLKNGEKLNSRGELYLTNEGFYNNGIVKRDGLVFLIKDGKVSPLNEDYFVDSTRISPKGIITTGYKQEKFAMKDGEMVGLDGSLLVALTGCADGVKAKKERFVLDHVLYKEGKVFITKDAETSLLLNDIALGNGSKVLKSGIVIKSNGSRIHLREGQRIALTGEEMTDEKLEETFNPDKNYLTMLHGKMWIVTDGKPANLKEDFVIKGKMLVKTDGFIHKSDGSKLLMKENDRLSFDGVFISLDKRPIPGQLPNEYYIMKLGKIWSVIDGKPTKLNKGVLTKEGTTVQLDGKITKKDKTQFVLKEGEKVDSKGDILPPK